VEGLLIPSANNLADLLAKWDAGSVPAFVAKMNATAQTLGLVNTHFADPSGLNPSSVSTASDLIALGQAAMGDPIFAQVVAMPQVSLPGGSVVYNYNYDLGRNGIIGIKTGSDSAAGGCFLFEARQKVDGRNVTVIGDVLGQQGVSPITAALTAAENMVKASTAALGRFTAVTAGQVFGKVTTPWGSSSKVVAASATQFFGWPGMTVEIRLLPGKVGRSLPAGSRVGTLELTTAAGQSASVPLTLAGPINGPGAGWKLTRI
jgi:D-alanyl-D-alanine carboxypeptidase (penicillin-binding protein 5/6)